MAIALRKRLNGNKVEFLEYVGKYGIFGAMNKYDIKDYIAARKFLTEEGKDENFGLAPKLMQPRYESIETMLQSLVASFANYVLKKEEQIRRLEQELEAYHSENAHRKEDAAEMLSPLLDFLEVEAYNR